MSIETNPDIEERIADEIVVDCYDSEEVTMGWYYYLDDHLAFPFVATCKQALKVSPLEMGEEVIVTGMGDAGSCSSTMLVQIKWKGRSFSVPLSQLALDDENDDEETLQAIGDWEYWIESGRSF